LSNVAEFVEIRQGIEALAKEVAALVERKVLPQSRTKLDQASELLVKLSAIADNDVQDNAVGRLTSVLRSLEKKVGTLKPKKRAAKEETN
jgi:hypothetical protein